MVLENLGNSLKNTLSKIAGSLFVDERLIDELVRDIQRALLSADVNVKLVFDLTNKIKERALKEKPAAGLTKKEHLINIVYEQLVEFLGGDKTEINVESKKPFKIMLVGLFGSGKTTTSGKLAKYFAKRGKKVALVGLDIHRPAAMEQLKQIADSINVPAFIDVDLKDATEIYKIHEEELNKFDVVIVDTASRLHNKINLMNELSKIKNVMKKVIPDAPHEILLILDASIGQNAIEQAKQFTNATEVNALALTKLDGTAKGGVVIGISDQFKIPVKYIGIGERVEDLQVFNKNEFVDSLFKN